MLCIGHQTFPELTTSDLSEEGKRKEALRKPISGQLVISLRSARDLNHRALPRKSSKVYNETTVVIKIEGNERAVSHPSRNDRWLEDFEISVDKANEVELTIYDSVAPGDSAPIGMLWLRVSDLMEALRRQKVGMEGQGAGWVTADKAATMGPRQTSAQDTMSLHSSGTLRVPPSQGGDNSRLHEGIDGWWSVEPAGAISLKLDFGKFAYELPSVASADTTYSQGHRWRWQTTVRGSRSTGRRPKEKGRCIRDERPQVRSATVLPAHHVRPLPGVPPHRRRLSVRGLSIRLPQEVLPEGRYQVYLQVERRWRRGRGEDQSSNPSSIRRVHQHVGKLVLSLWLHAAFRTKELCQVLRVLDYLSSDMLPLGPGLLRNDDGNGQHLAEELARHQDDTGAQEAHSSCFLHIVRVDLARLPACFFARPYTARKTPATATTAATIAAPPTSPATACTSGWIVRCRGTASWRATASAACVPTGSAIWAATASR